MQKRNVISVTRCAWRYKLAFIAQKLHNVNNNHNDVIQTTISMLLIEHCFALRFSGLQPVKQKKKKRREKMRKIHENGSIVFHYSQ